MSDLENNVDNEAQEGQFDRPVKFSRGQVLFCEGDASQYLYLVIKGEVRIVRESDGRFIPIAVIRPGEFIGELSMFNDGPRSASAVAVQDSEAYMIKKSDIRKVVKTCPDWVGDIMKTLADRLKGSIDMLREHKIVDRVVDPGNDLSQELEAELRTKEGSNDSRW